MLSAIHKPAAQKEFYGTYTDDDLSALSGLPRSAAMLWLKIRLKGPANRPIFINDEAIATELNTHAKTIEKGLRLLEKKGLLSAPLKGNKNWRVLYHARRSETAPVESETTPTRSENAPNWSETAPKPAPDNRSQTEVSKAVDPTDENAPTKIDKETYKETQQAATVGEAVPGDVVLLKNEDQEKRRGVIKRLLSVGVSDVVAYQLAKSYPLDRITQQLDWLPDRPADNKAGLLVKAVKENFAAPVAIAKAAEQKAEDERQTARKRDQVLSEVKLRLAERQKPVMQRAAATVYGFIEMAKTLRKPVPTDDEISAKIENAAVAIANRDALEEEQDRRALALVGLSYDELLRGIL